MIKIRDECTKNHKEVDQPQNSALLLENKTDRQCPVHSYKMYISHLHLDNTYLWKKPNLNPKNRNSEIWYTRGHLGKTPLDHFVAEICQKVSTSKPYTNHCMRVSTTNMVTNRAFSMIKK